MKLANNQKVSILRLCYLVACIICYLLHEVNITTAIACYSCVSMNRSNPACEDPISAEVTIQRPCRQTIPGHKGLFYAHYCSKIKGIRQKDGSSLLIRRCSMDKLADIPTHCGQFQLDDDLYHGCIATCSKDWCNNQYRSSAPDWTLYLLTLLYTVII
ncbi:splicing factor 4 [Schistosoma japonicum]|nr:splicing factor 4 [Schistosoma japonicum]